MGYQNMVHYKPGRSSFIGWIQKRLRQKNNCLVLVYGQTGSGKSMVCLRLAHELDNEFDERQVVFGFSEFLQVVNADWFKEKKIKQIVFEEAQTSLNARAWQSMANRLINHLLSTFRAQQIIVYFNCPYRDFLDSQSQKLIHVAMRTLSINRNTSKCTVRFSLEEYNSDMGKYYHHPLFVVDGKKKKKINQMFIKLPPEPLRVAYEVKKASFLDESNKMLLEKVHALEHPEEKKQKLTLQQAKARSLYLEHKSFVKVAEIMEIDTSTAHKYCRAAENKGYPLESEENRAIMLGNVEKALNLVKISDKSSQAPPNLSSMMENEDKDEESEQETADFSDPEPNLGPRQSNNNQLVPQDDE